MEAKFAIHGFQELRLPPGGPGIDEYQHPAQEDLPVTAFPSELDQKLLMDNCWIMESNIYHI